VVFILSLPGGLAHFTWAADNLNLSVNATILNNPCTITLDTPVVRLPTVLAHDLNASVDTPTNYGTPQANFTINVTGCEGDSDGIAKLHMRFSPSGGAFPVGYKQVFINDAEAEASGLGAKGVGIVVFYHATQQNVLGSDGVSDVVIPVTAQYQGKYAFDTRYQKVGEVSGGMVSSDVVVSVDYE